MPTDPKGEKREFCECGHTRGLHDGIAGVGVCDFDDCWCPFFEKNKESAHAS